MRKGIVALCVAGMVLAVTGSAQADSISYTVGSTGPMHFPGNTVPAGAYSVPDNYSGDAVQLFSGSGSITLADGWTGTGIVNTVRLTIWHTYAGTDDDPYNDFDANWNPLDWDILHFPFAATRDISFGAEPAAGSISQPGLLDVTWDGDYLSFAQGTQTSFIVQGFQVNVTPLATVTPLHGWDPTGQQIDADMYAQFDVSLAPVPEPASMGILGMGLLGLVVTRMRRRQAA